MSKDGNKDNDRGVVLPNHKHIEKDTGIHKLFKPELPQFLGQFAQMFEMPKRLQNVPSRRGSEVKRQFMSNFICLNKFWAATKVDL